VLDKFEIFTKMFCYVYWVLSIILFLSKKLNISEVEPAPKLCFIDKSKTTENNRMYHFGKSGCLSVVLLRTIAVLYVLGSSYACFGIRCWQLLYKPLIQNGSYRADRRSCFLWNKCCQTRNDHLVPSFLPPVHDMVGT